MTPERRHLLRSSPGLRVTLLLGVLWTSTLPLVWLRLGLIGHDVHRIVFMTVYWAGVIACAGIILTLRRRTLRRYPFTGCRHCGYERRGLPAGAPCPECGGTTAPCTPQIATPSQAG